MDFDRGWGVPYPAVERSRRRVTFEPPIPRHELQANIYAVEELVKSSSRVDEGARRKLLGATFGIRDAIAGAEDPDLSRWNGMLIRCREKAGVFEDSDLDQNSVEMLAECIARIGDQATGEP